jgi:hypothetical protein
MYGLSMGDKKSKLAEEGWVPEEDRVAVPIKQHVQPVWPCGEPIYRIL